MYWSVGPPPTSYSMYKLKARVTSVRNALSNAKQITIDMSYHIDHSDMPPTIQHRISASQVL